MNIKEKIFFFTFALLVFVLPISKAVCNVAEVILILFSIYRLREVPFKENLRLNIHVALLGFIFLAYIIGMIHTENIPRGLKFINTHHRFIAFPFIVITNLDYTRKYFKNILYAFIMGTSVAGAFTLFLYLLPEHTVISLSESASFFTDYPKNDDRLKMGLYSPFIDRIQFSNMLAIAVLSCIYLLIKKEKSYIVVPLLLLLFVSSMMLGGRGGQLGLVAGLVVYVLYFGLKTFMPILSRKIGKTQAILAVILTSLILTVALPVCLFYSVPAIKDRYGIMLKELDEFAHDKNNSVDYEHKTTVRRIISWQNHWEVIKNYPWFGVGTGDYEDALQVAYDHDQFDVPVNAHSQYLQIWVSLGIFGLLLFMGIIFYWVKKIYEDSPEFIFALAFIVFYLVSFIPDAVLITQIDNVAFACFFSVLGVQKKGLLSS